MTRNKLCTMGLIYSKQTMDAAATAISSLGFGGVQITANFADSDPQRLDETGERIRAAFTGKGLEIVALDAYVNLVNPNREVLERELARFRRLIQNCKHFGTNILATETGTRGLTNQTGFVSFEAHPDNETEETWRELRSRVEELVRLAEENDVIIALEGVITNVVNTPEKALRMLDEVRSPHLRVVLDVFNYIHKEDLSDVPGAMETVLRKLAPVSVIAHAKDLLLKDGKMVRPGPGLGTMKPEAYRAFLNNLAAWRPDLPLVIEHVNQDQLADAKNYVENCAGL